MYSYIFIIQAESDMTTVFIKITYFCMHGLHNITVGSTHYFIFHLCLHRTCLGLFCTKFDSFPLEYTFKKTDTFGPGFKFKKYLSSM